MDRTQLARCLCGSVELETRGEPILAAACHCADCSAGSLKIEALPKAPPILDSYGGTPYLLYRRDRVSNKKGEELFKSIKVDEDSPNRVFASCCNTFMFLDLDRKLHWIPICRGRFPSDAPPLEMRINAKFGSGQGQAPNDVPCFSSFPLKFVGKLLYAKLAMIFS